MDPYLSRLDVLAQREAFVKAIDPKYFHLVIYEFDGNNVRNNLYYLEKIDNHFKHLLASIDNLNLVNKEKLVLSGLSTRIQNLFIETVDLFIFYHLYDTSEQWFEDHCTLINQWNITYKLVSHSKAIIGGHLFFGTFQAAIRLKDYLVYVFESGISLLSDLFIDIFNSPIKEKFDQFIVELKDTIQIEQIKVSSNTISPPDRQQTCEIPYDPEVWDSISYELFTYLLNNYCSSKGRLQQVRLISLWFFLNEQSNAKYFFNIKKNVYVELVKKNLGIKISHLTRDPNYEEKFRPVLQNFLQEFESINVKSPESPVK